MLFKEVLRRSLTALLLALALAVPFATPAGAAAQLPIPLPRVEPNPGGGITITVPPDLLRRIPSLPNLPVPRPPVAPPAAPTAPRPGPVPTPPSIPAPAVPTLPVPGAPVVPGATSSAGRTFGIFVGITDYANANDLAFCADDARRMRDAYVNGGYIAAQDAVVLTDAMATRGNVLAALQRANRALGPDGTLVFFFSGHGNRIADQNGDEADGQDETIVLYDGSFVDDYLAQLLRETAGRDVLALDSCFSGGFQRDLTRAAPNSVGFYASREDQLAYVAEEYRAGGYLSHFLREAVEGQRGRPIEMWQLQQHLAQGFRQSGAQARQELTVGVSQGVSHRTVLFQRPGATPPAAVARR